ncbi:hypothetical protein pb186bvf_016463 [Paramecium bursaria]
MLKLLNRVVQRRIKIGCFFCTQDKINITQEQIEALKNLYENKVKLEDVKDHIKIEDVFKTREQQLSFKLMNCQSMDEIFQLYSDQLLKQFEENDSPLNTNELSLFIYFTGQLRGEAYAESIEPHTERFLQIMNACIVKSADMDPQQYNAFLWALSIFKVETGALRLNDQQEFLVQQKSDQIIDLIQPETLPSLAFALNTLLKDSSQLVLKISKSVQNNLTHIPPELLLSLTSALPLGSFTNSKLLYQHLSDSYEKELITSEQFVQVIQDYIRIQSFQNSDFLQQLLQQLLETINQNKQAILSQRIIDLIINLSQINNCDSEQLVRKLIKMLHQQSEKFNINEFVSFFLALPKIYFNISKEIHLEKTLAIMIELTKRSQVFRLNDLEQTEIIQILTACAALRLDRQDFIQLLIKQIELQYLNKDDLYCMKSVLNEEQSLVKCNKHN